MLAVAVVIMWAAYVVRDALLIVYVSGVLAIGFSPIVRVIEWQASCRSDRSGSRAARHPRALPGFLGNSGSPLIFPRSSISAGAWTTRRRCSTRRSSS
jgi:hypothetical protein